MTKKGCQHGLFSRALMTGVAIAGLTGAASAQESQDEDVIVVTGSRIPRPDLSSTSPLQVMSQEEITFQGRTSVEDLLATIPSVSAEFNQGVGNGTVGTATTQLRGLTSKRTLVLVNGNRLLAGDPRVPSADLNIVPTALLDRVDVITGGASAVYGSDAVAGVVNFIMDTDFEGFRFDAQTSFAWHENDDAGLRQTVANFNAGATVPIELAPSSVVDAETSDYNVVLGANSPDDRGNVTAYLGFRRINALPQSQRDYGACGLGTTSSANPGVYDYQFCAGSGNHAFGRFVDFGLANNPNGTNTFVPHSGSMAFNFGPFNYYQQDSTRYVAGFFSHYEINEHVEVYADLLFQESHQEAQAAPSGLFFNNGPVYEISCDNPLMSASQAAVICNPAAPSRGSTPNLVANGFDPGGLIADNLTIAYRMEGVPRNQEDTHTSYQMVFGARGGVSEGWDYDVHGQYGTVAYTQIFTGDVSNNRINQALNVILDSDGNPVCADPAAVALGCVPLNLFQARGGVTGTISEAQKNWILVDAFQTGRNTTQVVAGSLTGDLGQVGVRTPWAEDGAALALGMEYRRETLDLKVDLLNLSGDLSGSGGVTPPASGVLDVFEVFAETRIPLLQDQPLAHELALELGYRISDYSTSGQVEAYKYSVDWQPIEDIRVRGGFNRAVRAPNIVELFAPQVVGLASFNDPCSGATPVAGCENTFATPALAAAQLGSVPDCAAAQCSQLIGGDPNLVPEEADTTTIGFVYTPSFFPGFNLTVDWYDIEIKKTIVAGIGGALTLSQCISNNTFCGNIHRDPDTGALFGLSLADGYVINVNANIGALRTAGYDITAAYQFDIGGLGSLGISYSGTLVDSYEVTPGAVPGSYDCAGLYGLTCGQPLPEYRHQMRFTWDTPHEPLRLSLNWRHLDEVAVDVNQAGDPFLDIFGGAIAMGGVDALLPAYDYIDLAGTYSITDSIVFRAGINNALDDDPPAVDANNVGLAGTAAFGNGNTFPGVYDALGRVVFVGLTANF